MAYLLTAVLSYLVGSISMAYILARARHVDLKKTGSGNLGASNATILLGWRVGVTVAVHDVLKALLCVAVTRILMPEDEYIGAIAGVSCVLGHIYPFYLRFRGGKGFASFVGMTIALNWKVALAVVILALIVTVVTDYIAIATVTTSVVVPHWHGDRDAKCRFDAHFAHRNGCDAPKAPRQLRAHPKWHRKRSARNAPRRGKNGKIRKTGLQRSPVFDVFRRAILRIFVKKP